MNIIKLQDQLKGIPDQALVGYVQNPTGEVPTYLALSELQRRKTMREKYQQQKTPQTTVAEDLAAPPPPMEQGIASVAPQQMAAQQPMPEQAPVEMAEGGLAELDVGDMYDEQNFATGGIVAFDEGGEIKNGAEGGGVQYDDGSVGYPIGGYVVPALMATGRMASRYGGRGLKYLKEKALGTPSVTAPTMNLPTGSITPILEAGTKGFLSSPGTYIDAAVIGGVLYGIDHYGNKTPITEQEASKIATQKLEAENLKSMEDHGAAREASGKGGYTYQPGESATKSPSDTYFDTINQFMPKSSAGDSIKTDLLTHDPTLFSRGLEKPEDAFTAGTKRYEEYMGENTALKEAQERLKAREAKLATRDKDNVAFSLLQAAAPMFNARTLGEGISKAVPAGVSSYISGRDKLDDIRDKIDATTLELGQAQRAEKTNMFKYGDDDRRTAKAAQVAAAKEDKLRGLHVQEFNINQNNKRKELGLQAELVDIKRADLGKDIAFGDRQLSIYEKRFEIADKATQAKMAQIKANAVKEANRYVLGNPPEVRALVKQFTDQGKKTYGNPEFDGKLNLIKNSLVGMYLSQAGLGDTDDPAIPDVSDLLKQKSTTAN
jgi:hypothetical protein